MLGNHSINYWRHLNCNFHRMKQVSQKPYPITMKHYATVRNEINKLLDAQMIHSSHSSWSAPIIVVPKGDGGKCLLIDYGALNKVTRKFMQPMPRVEDIFSKLNGAKYFTTLDRYTGYLHIPIDEDSIPKTAFTSPFGKYEYLKVPIGLAQAPAYFQELLYKVLKDLLFTIAYLDTIIIYSKTAKEHLDHWQQVFNKCHDAKLTMKLSKCHFFSKEIQYLGHVLSTTGMKPLPSKTAAIKLMKPPKNAKQVRAFLVLLGYYCKFIKNFAWIAKPLTVLTHHDAKFAWTSDHHTAFNTPKSTLLEAPILHYPDPSKWYIV